MAAILPAVGQCTASSEDDTEYLFLLPNNKFLK
jgi:hypothetical protein